MKRIVLRELDVRPGTTQELAQSSAISEGAVLVQLRDANERIKRQLGYRDDPLTASVDGGWRADGVAGLVRLSSEVELEIVPKYLSVHDASWRADFFLLAVLVETGHLLVEDEISSGVEDRGDLATLVARALLRMHAENARRPIRSYRRVDKYDFAVDGDVDWATLAMPDSDGYRQSRLELTRENPFNATLAAAVDVLLPEVSDTDTEAQLRMLRRALGKQAAPPVTPPSLSPRHAGWQTVFDLSEIVLRGLGLELNGGAYSGPGFVLSTWSAWQSLCELVVRRALGGRQVVGQKRWPLGRRDSGPLTAVPDISVLSGLRADILFDAKYKGRTDRSTTIAQADIYESLAFMRAAQVSRIGLIYPSSKTIEVLPLGGMKQIETVRIDQQVIEGIELQIRGLSNKGGFDRLVAGVRQELSRRLAGECV